MTLSDKKIKALALQFFGYQKGRDHSHEDHGADRDFIRGIMKIWYTQVLDMISRLPGMSGEANDAVLRVHPGQYELCSQVASASGDGMPNSVDQATSKSSSETLG